MSDEQILPVCACQLWRADKQLATIFTRKDRKHLPATYQAIMWHNTFHTAGMHIYMIRCMDNESSVKTAVRKDTEQPQALDFRLAAIATEQCLWLHSGTALAVPTAHCE